SERNQVGKSAAVGRRHCEDRTAAGASRLRQAGDDVLELRVQNEGDAEQDHDRGDENEMPRSPGNPPQASPHDTSTAGPEAPAYLIATRTTPARIAPAPAIRSHAPVRSCNRHTPQPVTSTMADSRTGATTVRGARRTAPSTIK